MIEWIFHWWFWGCTNNIVYDCMIKLLHGSFWNVVAHDLFWCLIVMRSFLEHCVPSKITARHCTFLTDQEINGSALYLLIHDLKVSDSLNACYSFHHSIASQQEVFSYVVFIRSTWNTQATRVGIIHSVAVHYMILKVLSSAFSQLGFLQGRSGLPQCGPSIRLLVPKQMWRVAL